MKPDPSAASRRFARFRLHAESPADAFDAAGDIF